MAGDLWRGRCAAWIGLAGLLVLGAPDSASAQTVHPHELVGDNLEEVFGFPNILFHAGAAFSLPPVAFSGADRSIQDWFQSENPLGRTFPRLMLDVGFYSTVAPALALYGGGLVFGDEEIASAGAAVLQAQALQAVLVMLLKFATDRAAPFRNGVDTGQRRVGSQGRGGIRRSQSATDFRGNPSTWEGGIMWPSGHTSSHVALVSTLTAFFPGEVWIPLVGYPLAALMAIAMVDGDFHWFSDIVAGAIIGHVIGWVVGKNFRAEFDARNRSPLPTPLRQENREQLPSTFQIGFALP